jgi:hypothetical protein
MSQSFVHRRATVAQFIAKEPGREKEAIAPFQRRKPTGGMSQPVKETEVVLDGSSEAHTPPMQ